MEVNDSFANPQPDRRQRQSENEYTRRLHQVLLYIHDNLSSELDLDKLAGIACFSKFHFHRIFSAYIGETPNDYIIRLRLERAANLILSDPTLLLAEIGERCGFTSQAFFSRSFRKQFGASPSHYFDYKNSQERQSKKSQIVGKKVKNSGSTTDYLFDENNIFSSEKEIALNMDCEIKQMPQMKIMYLVHHGGYNRKIGLLWHKLIARANQLRIFSPNTSFIGIPLDNPDITSPEKCRYKVALSVPETTTADGEYGVEDIPELTCLVSHFSGTEDQISTGYTQIYKKFLPERNLLPADYPCYEIHRNNPEQDPEHKFIYDICVPIREM